MTGEYRFDQIAIVGTEKKKPTDADKNNYIGLEHLSPETFDVVDYGSEVAPKGEKLVMRKGDVLFGKRRAYQKKVGIAPCDGIFSAHGMVLRPNEDVVDARFFPFFIKSDVFLDEAIRISVGSLSPTVNWRDLRELKFNLPSLDHQHEVAELLWAGENLKTTYRRLLSACGEQVKSRFIEMFGNGGYPEYELGECLEQVVAGVNVNGQQRPIKAGEFAVLKISAVTKGYFKSDEYKVIDDPGSVSRMVFPRKGDLLFSRANTREMVGATAIVDADYDNLFLPDKLWRLDFKPEIMTVYAKCYLQLDTTRKVLSSLSTGTSGSMYNISMKKLRGVRMPVPPIELQEEFAAFVQQVDKSEFALKQAIEGVNATMTAILNKELGMSDVQ